MKTSIALPLLLGLMLAGCSRTSTDSTKISSTDQSDANKPAVADDQALSTKAASPADSNSTTQAQVAAAPAPAIDVTKEVIASTPDNTFNSSMAANPTPAPSTMPMPASTAFDPSLSKANPPVKTSVADLVTASKDTLPDISARITEWKLQPEDIKAEVDAGRVERSRTPGAGEPTGPMDNMLVDQITTRLQKNPDTSMLKLDVTADHGVVTLNGSARTLEQIGHAIALSLDTGGVTQTISQIKLQTPQ